MANVNAIPDGREKNVPFDMMSAKYPIAMDMGIVPTESATVYVAIKENTARKSIVHIQLAQATVSAPRALVYVKKAGKEPIVVKWTRKLCSVFPIAVVMEISILRLKLASASPCGRVMIVRRVRKKNIYHIIIYLY